MIAAHWRRLLLSTAAVLLAATFAVALHGQSHPDAQNHAAEISIPFVGCPSFGQAAKVEAPTGTDASLPLDKADAQSLALYKSGDEISVLAPRGWHCQGASGSGGAALFVAPGPIRFSRTHWEGIDGPVIELNSISSENSGRYEIAELIGRVFPAYRPFARQIWRDLDVPFPSSPYPKDTVKRIGKSIVEYRTPRRTQGLGNFGSYIGRNEMPITGTAILLVDPTNPSRDISRVILLSIRIPPEMKQLAPAIVAYVEQNAGSASHR